jgi:putative RecB family exonuclease
MPEGPINHFSYSQLSTYLSCPLQYRLKYVDLIPPAFKSASLAFGSSIHEAVAAYYQSRLEGDTLQPHQMVDVYRDTWRGAEGVKFFNGDNGASLLEKASQLINVFHEQVDPKVTVLGVEEFFEVQVAKEVPPIHGYIDLIGESPDGRVTVADLKTAAKKLVASAVHGNLQLTAYSLGAQALGFDPDQLTLRLDVLTKTKNPELVRYETTRTVEQRERFVKLVRQVWQAIEHHAFYPKEDWHCSQCAYVDNCKKW